MGRAPAVKGSPDRRISEATSVIFSVLLVRWRIHPSTARWMRHRTKRTEKMTLVASDMRRSGEPLTAGARPIRSVPARSSPARSAKAVAGEGGKFGRWLLASRLYSLTLGYGTPKSFFAVAPDTWPGDQATGQRLLMGELLARGSAGPAAPAADDPPWQRAAGPALWPDAPNAFAGLRDPRDCGARAAAPLAVRLVDD